MLGRLTRKSQPFYILFKEIDAILLKNRRKYNIIIMLKIKKGSIYKYTNWEKYG